MEVVLSRPKSAALKKDEEVDPDKSIKIAIWAYFILIIFEGALRRWILPGIADELLVIRDPIAIWLMYKGWQRGLFPSTPYMWGTILIGLISIYTAMFTGHGNIIVALYGARIFLLHFPLMFIIGRIFTREDIIKMGKVTLLIGVPMALLITLQFYSPQSAFVNRGVAGDINGAGFSGSGDFKRPPGTFSFTNGTSLFFGWLAPFVFYFWFNLKKVNFLILLAASGALIISIPFSISRTLLFEFSLTVAFTVFASVRKPQYIGKVIMIAIAALVSLVPLSQTHFVSTAIGAFLDRFTNANETEGGLVKGVIGDRFFGGLFSALQNSGDQPFWGFGVGMGTNAGAQILTGDNKVFLISEAEWGRLVGELGPLMGITAILLRVGFTFKLAFQAYQKLVREDLLPWLLLSFAFIPIIQGQWAQPTSLGFSVMIGGLLISALQHPPVAE